MVTRKPFSVAFVACFWNVMAHAQKPVFVFRQNGRVHLNWQGLQFSRLLAAEVCASAVVMLDTPCSEVVWRVLHSPVSPSLPLPCVTVCHHISTGLYTGYSQQVGWYFGDASFGWLRGAVNILRYFVGFRQSLQAKSRWCIKSCHSGFLLPSLLCYSLTFRRRNYFFNFSTLCI